MDRCIRWGILGTGKIAHKFAQDLLLLPDAQLAAVGSRTAAAAAAFGAEYRIPRCHGSYEALAADLDVDAVYVATPNTLHRENTLLCLNHGKAVICEKPFAMNTAETEEMIACARRQKVFLMEAMWMRFLPVMVRLRELLRAGAIGDVRLLDARFCFRAEWQPEGRLLNPALGGGSLLDVGIYNTAFADVVFGRPPAKILSLADIGKTGVDETASVLFGYDNGAMASLTSSVRVKTLHDAVIYGTAGMIRIPEPYWRADKFVLIPENGPAEEIAAPKRGLGYLHEAEEVMRCLREGRTESLQLPLAATLAAMQTLDAIRRQW